MKKNLTKLLAVSGIGLLLLGACKKNDALVTANNGTAGTLTASTTNLVLDKTKYDSTANVINFSFTAANFGFSAAVTNTLQIDAAKDNWANPTSVVLGANILSQGYATANFNSMLLKLNLPAGVASQVNVRIVHSISPTVTPVYSNVLSLTVTPFNLISYVYVPGTYQSTISSNQWTPATADSLVSPTDNGVYTGYVYFQGGDNFKVTPAPNWNVSYGDAGNGAISTSGGNLTAPATPGLYLVTVDLNKNTIAYSPNIHTWSLIGTAAVDWNTDIQMPFVQNSNVYQTTYALNSAGQFKFRADDAWTTSLGDVSPVDGQLTSNNGANINVPSNGNYVISLSWGNPLLAPTYTLLKQ
jgi:starch-binding outer membrane protein SusE/F